MSESNRSGSKYLRELRCLVDGKADVYTVVETFDVRCPARVHAIKKLLCSGIRGKGDTLQDLSEARDAITRAIQMHESNNPTTGTTITVGDHSYSVTNVSIGLTQFEPKPRPINDIDVGNGYRLATDDDKDNPRIEMWDTLTKAWGPRSRVSVGVALSKYPTLIYRVPVEPQPINDDPDGVGKGYRRATHDDVNRSDIELRAAGSRNPWDQRTAERIGAEYCPHTEYRVPL